MAILFLLVILLDDSFIKPSVYIIQAANFWMSEDAGIKIAMSALLQSDTAFNLICPAHFFCGTYAWVTEQIRQHSINYQLFASVISLG